MLTIYEVETDFGAFFVEAPSLISASQYASRKFGSEFLNRISLADPKEVEILRSLPNLIERAA